ncbi:MFS transporter [Glycomyces sp. A-F 0318]|uniref:MFS transporter n=1 Tax=Glycomyces amatae TaxID=2881355 RepID=UPI001E3F2688|nr:MFS transporter [Glycomyces amatae]MCD0444661.1 MFS transporter [Glycomyces amatae]
MDLTVPDAAPEAAQRTSPLTLPVVLVGVVLVAMSISGTAVALPSIGRDLGASGSPLNWVVAGYNLAFAAMTLVAGSTADRIGRRRVFVFSALVFAAGFAVTAASLSIVLTDIARIVSGAGGAGIMAAGGAILASEYEGAARNRAFALMGTMAGVGIAIGPTLSGLLIAVTGWRGGFAVFTVVGLLIVFGGTRIRESRASGSRTDRLGSGLFVAALTLLMYALIEAPELGWTHPAVLATAVAGFAALAVFALVQRRSAAPVLAPSLVANRGFMGWSMATLTTSIGFLGVLVFLPTYLQAAGGMSPALSGTAMLLLTAPVLAAPLAASGLVNRGVSARLLITLALAFVTAGNLWLTALDSERALATAAVPLLLIGIGMGASFGITDGQAMALVPAESVGMAAGFINTLRGAAEALVIAAFSASLIGLLTGRLGDGARAAAVSAGRTSADGRASELEAFTWSWRVTQLGVGLLCLVLAIIVALLIFGGKTGARRAE